MLRGCEFIERLPGETGPDPIGRDETAHDLTSAHVFHLPLGELVAVDPMDEIAEGRGQRQHRDLDHLETIRVGVDLIESTRMDQVFGIVRDHDIELNAVVFFKEQHALIDPIEAVGFGGGTIVRTHR